LRLFDKWLRENDISTDPNTWDASTIRRYLVYLRERDTKRGKPLSAYSIRCYASSVRAFCRWLKVEEITSRNVTE
jgi:site-specific recombinase XerD